MLNIPCGTISAMKELSTLHSQTEWQPTSWQQKHCRQLPHYPDQQALHETIDQLEKLPPLVTRAEIDCLQNELAEVCDGKRFILLGGDCAEDIDKCAIENIQSTLKILWQMSLILIHGQHKPITRIGRIAGQYAKPRTDDLETRDGISLPSYRGDLINRHNFTKLHRTPNPELLIRGYHTAATTLNYVQTLLDGSFADLQHPEQWDLPFETNAPLAKRYHQLVDSITDLEKFLMQYNIPYKQFSKFYTAHEALLLYYDQAFTRKEQGKYYNLSTHYPWIGMRTAFINEAHIEYARGIANPIAVKIGPEVTKKHLQKIIELLNPDNIPGRLTLTHRFGAECIADCLPPLINIVQEMQAKVIWSCDPMHGNTKNTQFNVKTRHFEDILSELQQAFQIHAHHDSYLGGVHFELTGENVTECVGGAMGLKEFDLKRAYQSLVDPRLNYNQALEMAILLAY
jgi:3-deoxy-7-phosphoheptulonate synthase